MDSLSSLSLTLSYIYIYTNQAATRRTDRPDRVGKFDFHYGGILKEVLLKDTYAFLNGQLLIKDTNSTLQGQGKIFRRRSRRSKSLSVGKRWETLNKSLLKGCLVIHARSALKNNNNKSMILRARNKGYPVTLGLVLIRVQC